MMSDELTPSISWRAALAACRTLLGVYTLFLLYAYGLTIVFGVLNVGCSCSVPGGPAEMVIPVTLILAVASALIAGYLIAVRRCLGRFERAWVYALIVAGLAYFPIGAFFLYYL